MIESARDLADRLEKVRDLESRMTFRLSVVSKLLDHQTTEILADTPINLSQYRVMMVVDTFEAISISDISRFNAIDRGQISRTAAELERRGFVSFQEDPSSKRKKLVLLTGEGEKVLEQVRPKLEARRNELREHLGEEAHDAIMDSMVKMTEFVDA